MLDQWRNSGYRLVLGVPILPGGSGGTLAEGAAGCLQPVLHHPGPDLGQRRRRQRHPPAGVGVQRHLVSVERRQQHRRPELRRVLAPDRRHHAGRAGPAVQVPVESQRRRIVELESRARLPGLGLRRLHRHRRLRRVLGQPLHPAGLVEQRRHPDLGPQLADDLRRRRGQAHRHPGVVGRLPRATGTAWATTPTSSTSSPTGSRPTTWRSRASSPTTTPPAARTTTSPTAASPTPSPPSGPTSADRRAAT